MGIARMSIPVHSYFHVPCRRERQLNEAAYRIKRSSSSTAYPHDHRHSDSTEDEQLASRFTGDHTPKLDPKKETATPKSDRKRYIRRKRRSGARHTSEGQGFLDKVTNNDLTRRQSLPPLQSLIPPPHTTHTPSLAILTPPDEEKYILLKLDLQSQDSPPEDLPDGTAAISPGGTLSPGVTELLERVPSLRRTDSNGSTKSRRRGSRNGSPLNLSPVKRQVSGATGFYYNCPLPSAASSSRRASNKTTPVHESIIPYSKLGMSDFSSESTENETGTTHSSAIAGNITSTTTSTYDDDHVPARKRNSDTLREEDFDPTTIVNVEASLRSICSNESSIGTRASDGGNDADSESNNGDDPLSEFETAETNDSTLGSAPSPSVPDSDDSPSTHNLLYGTETVLDLEPKNMNYHQPSYDHYPPNDTHISILSSIVTDSVLPHDTYAGSETLSILNHSTDLSSLTTRKQVAQLISKFESVDNISEEGMPRDSTVVESLVVSSGVSTPRALEVPLHIRRPITRDHISGSYSPKQAEEVWRKGECFCKIFCEFLYVLITIIIGSSALLHLYCLCTFSSAYCIVCLNC